MDPENSLNTWNNNNNYVCHNPQVFHHISCLLLLLEVSWASRFLSICLILSLFFSHFLCWFWFFFLFDHCWSFLSWFVISLCLVELHWCHYSSYHSLPVCSLLQLFVILWLTDYLTCIHCHSPLFPQHTSSLVFIVLCWPICLILGVFHEGS